MYFVLQISLETRVKLLKVSSDNFLSELGNIPPETKTRHILNSKGREGQERVKCFDDANVG